MLKASWALLFRTGALFFSDSSTRLSDSKPIPPVNKDVLWMDSHTVRWVNFCSQAEICEDCDQLHNDARAVSSGDPFVRQIILKRSRQGFGFSVAGTCPVQVCSVEEGENARCFRRSSRTTTFPSSDGAVGWEKFSRFAFICSEIR